MRRPAKLPFPSLWVLSLAVSLAFATACSDDSGGNTTGDAGDVGADGDVAPDSPPAACSEDLAAAVVATAESVQTALSECYHGDGGECADGALTTTLDDLAATATASCNDEEIAALLGDGAVVTSASWAGRLAREQVTGAHALARRVFGGPLGTLLADANANLTSCLDAAWEQMATYYRRVITDKLSCLLGEGCDGETLGAALASAAQDAANAIDDTCGSQLRFLASTPESLITLAEQEADCAVATVTSVPGAIDVDCGPANPGLATLEAAGTWTAVTLDPDVWGTRCGDGSDFAFWVRLGSEPEKIFIDLAGGGVCLDEAACRSAEDVGLLTAQDDLEAPPSGGFAATDSENPFATWTYVRVPYCTQDVFGGGGGVETLNEDTSNPPYDVQRYGALDARAAARFVRDALWQELDATAESGYDPADVTVLFGGTSAGGYGTYLNHAYLLDALGWSHTFANPRVWLSLSALANPIEGLFVLKEASWRLLDVVPSYCNAPVCATGNGFIPRHAPRLDDQSLFLVASSQVDRTQSNETFHPSIFEWTNLARELYCDLQGTENVYFFMLANPEPIQALIDGDTLDASNSGHDVPLDYAIDGVTFLDWLGGIVADPGSAVDHVEEGDLVTLSQDESLTDLPGYEPIEPFTCLSE